MMEQGQKDMIWSRPKIGARFSKKRRDQNINAKTRGAPKLEKEANLCASGT